MKLVDQPFEVEVFLDTHKPRATIDLASSGIESVSIRDLLAQANDDQQRRLFDSKLNYPRHAGGAELVQAIADRYSPPVMETSIMVTTGAQEAIFLALNAVLGSEFDAVVVVPNYQSVASIAGTLSTVRRVPLDLEHAFSLSLDKLFDAVSEKTALIAINCPNNPTGYVMTGEMLEEIIRFCRKRGIWLLSDEVYRGMELDYVTRLPSVAEQYERGIAIDGVSKRHGAPGTRIGWIACQDRNLLHRCLTLRSYLSVCSSSASEVLAEIALRASSCNRPDERRRAIRNRERLALFAGENSNLMDGALHGGLPFAFPRLKEMPADVLANSLLRETGVLILPGSVFGAADFDYRCHFRINLIRDSASEGLSRLMTFMQSRRA